MSCIVILIKVKNKILYPDLPPNIHMVDPSPTYTKKSASSGVLVSVTANYTYMAIILHSAFRM